jgi:hypothetical protein
LAKTQTRKLATRITVILAHLIKPEAAPATAPRPGWRATIRRERNEIALLLADAPRISQDAVWTKHEHSTG